MKICTKCKIDKPAETYHKDAARKPGLKSWCKDCTNAWKREHRNKAKAAEHWKKWSAENKEKRAAYYARPDVIERQRKYNAERYKKKKAHINQTQEAWRVKNKDRMAAKEAARRFAKENATPKWLTQEHHDEIEWIYFLREEMSIHHGTQYHVDHIVPLKGKNVTGLHVPWNLQILSASENLSKSNSTRGL